MSRFEQRLRKALEDEEVARGYWEMDAELQLMQALEEIRQQEHITQQELAERMGRKRESIARLFATDDPNPTLNTLIELLSALRLTADITLRHSEEGEGPISIRNYQAQDVRNSSSEQFRALEPGIVD